MGRDREGHDGNNGSWQRGAVRNANIYTMPAFHRYMSGRAATSPEIMVWFGATDIVLCRLGLIPCSLGLTEGFG